MNLFSQYHQTLESKSSGKMFLFLNNLFQFNTSWMVLSKSTSLFLQLFDTFPEVFGEFFQVIDKQKNNKGDHIEALK